MFQIDIDLSNWDGTKSETERKIGWIWKVFCQGNLNQKLDCVFYKEQVPFEHGLPKGITYGICLR